MTDSPDLHLDDELLSAVLDGEAEVEQSAHADACDACRARLGALRDASVLVATPVPPADPARRDAAIAAALAAASDGGGGTVVPLRRRRSVPTWLGAAAAVVVAVGAISLLANRGSDEDTSSFDTAAEGDDAGGSDTMAADEDATTMALQAPVVDGGDLGEIDVTTLQQTIEGAFGSTREAYEETGPAADAPAAESQPVIPCDQEIRDDSPDLGSLAYHATGTVDGVPVVVLAFDVPPDRWVYVVTVDGCSIRNQQTYSP